MKGLIKKDFLLLKGNLTYFLIVTIVFSVFTLTGFAFNILFILPFITIMLFISTFNWDDFNNWNAYAITLPIERKNIVKSKYISAMIILLISITLGIIISFLTTIISKNNFNMMNILSDILGTALGLMLVLAIWLPCIYQFGVEKGRIMLFISVFSITILASIASKFIDFTTITNIINSLDNIWMIIIPILAIATLIISYFISKKIFLKKEF